MPQGWKTISRASCAFSSNRGKTALADGTAAVNAGVAGHEATERKCAGAKNLPPLHCTNERRQAEGLLWCGATGK